MQVVDRWRKKFSSHLLEGIVRQYPAADGILRPYDQPGLIIARVENLDYLSLRYPTPDEVQKMNPHARFIGDCLVIRMGPNGVRSSSPQIVDSDRVYPEDICPMRRPALTIVITCLVDEFALLYHVHK